MLPYEAATLISLFVNRNRAEFFPYLSTNFPNLAFIKSFSAHGRRHVVVTGFITSRTVRTFFDEWFRERTNEYIARSPVVVVLHKTDPSPDMRELLFDPYLRHFVYVRL